MADYKIVGDGQDEVLIAFLPGEDEPRTMHSSHPNWDVVTAALRLGDAPDPDLFSIATAIERRFARLSDRVTLRGSTLYLDEQPLDNALADTVLRFLDEGVDDWRPLIAYFEKVQANPSDNSREQLFKFLQANSGDFAIDPEGHILAYKGVEATETDGLYRSIHSGYAVVNGVESIGQQVEQRVGDVVEMPRHCVADDPAVHCSVGLHVSTHGFAQRWASGATLLVRVDPADVVSVPHDSSKKVRVCRYMVVGVVDKPSTEALYDWAGTREFSEPEDDGWTEGETCIGQVLEYRLTEETRRAKEGEWYIAPDGLIQRCYRDHLTKVSPIVEVRTIDGKELI